MVGLIEQEPILKLKKLFDTKEFDKIITYCHELLKKDGANLIALQNISTAYIMVGANNDAIKYCEKILEKEPNDEHALKNKVYANEKLENHNQVIVCCDKILSKYQNDIDALVAKGIAHNKIGNHEKAMENYKIVLNNDEKNIDALMNMATTLKFLKRFDNAIQYYDTIQKLYPNVKRASIEKYESFTELGEKDDAFLAAQGVTIDEANKIKKQAKDNEYTIQHAFSLRRFYELEKNNH